MEFLPSIRDHSHNLHMDCVKVGVVQDLKWTQSDHRDSKNASNARQKRIMPRQSNAQGGVRRNFPQEQLHQGIVIESHAMDKFEIRIHEQNFR